MNRQHNWSKVNTLDMTNLNPSSTASVTDTKLITFKGYILIFHCNMGPAILKLSSMHSRLEQMIPMLRIMGSRFLQLGCKSEKGKSRIYPVLLD